MTVIYVGPACRPDIEQHSLVALYLYPLSFLLPALLITLVVLLKSPIEERLGLKPQQAFGWLSVLVGFFFLAHFTDEYLKHFIEIGVNETPDKKVLIPLALTSANWIVVSLFFYAVALYKTSKLSAIGRSIAILLAGGALIVPLNLFTLDLLMNDFCPVKNNWQYIIKAIRIKMEYGQYPLMKG